MINRLRSEISKANELSLNSDDMEAKLVCTRERCRTQRRRECISESIISTGIPTSRAQVVSWMPQPWHEYYHSNPTKKNK